MDICETNFHGPHTWTSLRSTRGHFTDVPSWTKKKTKSTFSEKKQWHWRDLNSSLLHGSPVPNQLDHGGHLVFHEVYSSLYIQLKIQKKWTLQGPRGDFLGVIRSGLCADLPTWTTFGGALAVTLATVGIMAKSMQRLRKVHFPLKENGHFCFPAGHEGKIWGSAS